MSWWDKQRVEALVKLHDEGLSMSEIAQRLVRQFGGELSRNAVIGKALRLNLPPRKIKEKIVTSVQKPTSRLQIPKPRAPGRPAPVVKNDRASIKGRILPPEPLTGRALPGEPHMAPLPLMMRTRHQCCWPVNDGDPFLFCAMPKQRGDASYCAYHRQLSLPRSQPSRHYAAMKGRP